MTHVTACIDGSSTAPAVCDYASWSSAQLRAPLEFLHVLDKKAYPQPVNMVGNIGLGSRESLLKELTELDEKRGRMALEYGQLMLNSAKERAISFGITDVSCRQRHGDLVDTLIEGESDIRLLVMGKQGEGADGIGAHVGSNIERVVRTMHRPILVVPAHFNEPQNFMIAFDGSSTTRKVVEMVAASPLLKGLPCNVVLVGSETPDLKMQLDWTRATLESAGFFVTTALVPGDVKEGLCNYRELHDVDVLVMGAYGHSKIRQFLVGSTTSKMIQHQNNSALLLLR